MEEDFASLFGAASGMPGWEIAYVPPANTSIDDALFYEFRNSASNVSVVALRGLKVKNAMLGTHCVSADKPDPRCASDQ
jgi:hypothetical protein